MNKKRFALFAILLTLLSHSAMADGMASLANFVSQAKSGSAEFSQVVTSPSKDGQVAKSKVSSGTFEFLRPNRFKFVYKKPFDQTIVADGVTLWLYDADLKQVTARKQAATLGNTPAALIASAPNLKALQADYNLQSAPDKDGLQWVMATPKNKDGQLQSVQVGFKEVAGQPAELAVLEILDSFGQRSVMSFSQFHVNTTIKAADFQYKPPAGADVVHQ